MLIKQRSQSLLGNVTLVIFGELLVVFSTNLQFLFNMLLKCCPMYLIRQVIIFFLRFPSW